MKSVCRWTSLWELQSLGASASSPQRLHIEVYADRLQVAMAAAMQALVTRHHMGTWFFPRAQSVQTVGEERPLCQPRHIFR